MLRVERDRLSVKWNGLARLPKGHHIHIAKVDSRAHARWIDPGGRTKRGLSLFIFAFGVLVASPVLLNLRAVGGHGEGPLEVVCSRLPIAPLDRHLRQSQHRARRFRLELETLHEGGLGAGKVVLRERGETVVEQLLGGSWPRKLYDVRTRQLRDQQDPAEAPNGKFGSKTAS